MTAATTPPKYRGTALRDHVLEVALGMFVERGYFNTSIHDIRKQAGVSIGAIYHHFGTKDMLAKTLYDDLMARMELAVADAIASGYDFRSRVRAIIAVLFETTVNEPEMMDFIIMARHREFMPDEPPICSSKPFNMMKQVVEQGMADGEVRDMEPWVAASAVFGGALRMINLQLDGGLDKSLLDQTDPVMDCAWRAVAC